jgi:hypothetical protein
VVGRGRSRSGQKTGRGRYKIWLNRWASLPLPRSYVPCKRLYILKERHCNFKLNVLQWQWLQYVIGIAWRYQKGNQNPYIEEEQTTQWPTEKVQKNKQRSTTYTYKTKDRVTRTPLKPGVKSGAPECNRVKPHRWCNSQRARIEGGRSWIRDLFGPNQRQCNLSILLLL